MKIKTKMAIAATAIAFTSLMIMAYHTEPTTSPVALQIAPVSEVVEVGRATVPPTEVEPIVAQEIIEISTQAEELIEPTHQQEVIVEENEIPPPQLTEKEESNNTPTPTTQTATKINVTSTTNPPTPKNGDICIIDGQKQGYLLGFGWVDNMGKNKCIYAEGMYENGNKIGVMY